MLLLQEGGYKVDGLFQEGGYKFEGKANFAGIVHVDHSRFPLQN